MSWVMSGKVEIKNITLLSNPFCVRPDCTVQAQVIAENQDEGKCLANPPEGIDLTPGAVIAEVQVWSPAQWRKKTLVKRARVILIFRMCCNSALGNPI